VEEGETMFESQLQEIAVSTPPGAAPEHVADNWVQQLALRDGVRIAVVPHSNGARPRRYVAYQGQAISPRTYAALSIVDDVERLLRGEGRAMDAWEILQVARRRGEPLEKLPVATITQAARLLVRERRLYRGPARDTWMAPRTDEAVA
jgi:hypothetical protein